MKKRIVKVWIPLLLVAVMLLFSSCNTINGMIARDRILIESEEGYDLDQQMATFIVWQNLYQSYYQEWYYVYYGLSSIKIDTQLYPHPTVYAIEMAGACTTGDAETLRETLEAYGDYLAELVAGADAAAHAGLSLDANDRVAVDEDYTWVYNVFNSTFLLDGEDELDFYLDLYVSPGMVRDDVVRAYEIMAMYQKYCAYRKYRCESLDTPDFDMPDGSLDTSVAVHGGYFRCLNGAHASEVYAELSGKQGFALWQSFNALRMQSVVSDEGIFMPTQSYCGTAITAQSDYLDSAVYEWMCHDARQRDEVAVVRGDDGSYYVALYISSMPAWERTLKDEWISEQVGMELATAVKNGGYALATENVVGNGMSIASFADAFKGLFGF